MKLLCHRGFWSEKSEQNSVVAFKRALDAGWGIETDVRDLAGDLVISHDVPRGGETRFEAFLRLCEPYADSAVLALNIKSDGLQRLLKRALEGSPKLRYFAFDMSVPDALGYSREGLTFFTRQSEFEPTPSLYESARGVWLDCFSDESFIAAANIERHWSKGKDVAVVSPELHGRAPDSYWGQLKSIDDRCIETLMLCTDLPSKALEVVCGH